MQKKAKTIFVLGIVLGGVLLLSLVSVGYFVVRSRTHVKLYQEAMAAWEVQDIARARSLFLQVLKHDANNEIATVKLAEIAESEGDWYSAANYRHQARKLNELNDDYAESYLHAIRMGRFFGLISGYLKNLKRERTLEEQAMYHYCQLMIYKDRKSADEWLSLLKEKPEIGDTPYGKLIKVMFFSREETIGNIFASLDELSTSKDYPFVQEVLITRAQVERILKRAEEEEKIFKTAQEGNYFTVTPLLGGMYTHYGWFDKAADTMLPYLKRFYQASLAMNIGEFMIFSEKYDQLDTLLEEVNSHKDRKSILAGYYIDALKAFHDNDFQRLSTAMEVIGQGDVNTPLAALMRLAVDIQNNDIKRLEVDYTAFQHMPKFLDLHERANALVLLFLEGRLQAGEPLDNLAGLVTLASNDKAGIHSDTLKNAELVSKIQKGILTEAELEKILQSYDNEAGGLAAAVSFYYFKKNYTKVLEMFDRLRKLSENIPLYTTHQVIDSLIRLGRQEEALPSFRMLLTDYPDAENIRAFWRYAVLYHDREAFHFLAALPETLGTRLSAVTDEAGQKHLQAQIAYAKSYVPFCEVAVLFQDGNTKEAVATLQSLETDNEDLFFYKADKFRVSEHLEEALSTFRRISPRYVDYTYVLINISEILCDLERLDEALRVASAMWKQYPDGPDVLNCYASVLRKKNLWEEVLDCVVPAQVSREGNEVLFDTWVWAISARIEKNFGLNRLDLVEDDIRTLLRFDRDNQHAKDFLKRLDERQKQLDADKKE